MSDRSHENETRTVPLSLSPADQWTLHHVLLDRIEREPRAAEPTAIEPPPVEIFQAFETLDAGDTRLTVRQLDAIQNLLAEYHHAPAWGEVERARIERLLDRVTTLLDRGRATPSADRS